MTTLPKQNIKIGNGFENICGKFEYSEDLNRGLFMVRDNPLTAIDCLTMSINVC